MDVMYLIDKRNNLWQEAKNFLDEHTDSEGKISAEDAKTYDRMENEIVDLGKTIERYQRQAAFDLHLNSTMNKAILPEIGNAKKNGRASAEYKAAALTALRTNFKTIQNSLQESTDSLGGFLLPTEWDERLITGLNEENVMRQLGTPIITSGEHKINISGTEPVAVWADEGAAINFGDTTFAQITLSAHKLQVSVKVTNELLFDSVFDLESYIIEQFTQALANAEEEAFLTGAASDTNKPTGIFEAESVSTAGNNISADDLIDLVHSLKRPYRKNAVFIMNDSVIAAIRKLKDSNQAFMWQPSYQAGEPDRLLGYPVYTSAFAPSIATGAAVVAFGDMSYYNIADRGYRSFKELRELFMANDMTGFIMTERIDGALVRPDAVRVLKMK